MKKSFVSPVAAQRLLSILLLIILPAKSSCLFAQGFNLVDRVYETPYGEVGMWNFSVLADSAKLITTGNSERFNNWGLRVYESLLSIYDLEGHKLMQRHINLDDCVDHNTLGYSNVQKINNEMYVMAGQGLYINKRAWAGGLIQPYIHFFNSSGDSIKTVIIEDTLVDRVIRGLAVTQNHEILGIGYESTVTGEIATNASGTTFIPDSTYFWLCKFNSDGQLLWHKSFHGIRSVADGTFPVKLLVSADQATYTIAMTLDLGWTSYILKTDSAGNEIWQKSLQLRESLSNHPALEPSSPSSSFDISPAPDGYYFISSTPYKFFETVGQEWDSQYAFYYGKLDEQGDTIWTKQYQPYNDYNYNYGRQIQTAANGDLIMSGLVSKMKQNGVTYEEHAAVFRSDSLGNIKWYREPMHYTRQQNGGSYVGHSLFGLSLTPGRDGILAGGEYNGFYDPFLSTQPNNGNLYGWLILMDSLGRRCPEDTVIMNSPSPCPPVLFDMPTRVSEQESASSIITIYPNPADDYLNIKTIGAAQLLDGSEITISDVHGRAIIHSLYHDGISIYVGLIKAGIYVFTINQPQKGILLRQKLVKR
ncbi:T9SS type A sorting domain-containing protein [Taibaiella lutea]|uniref:T9SS type A sorting domain-containing protein n=1 Tax=Taibaiella lutea TaxID=2608001 RepID=A0A5M6CMW3_9BACT|nr:T9SS type A sorting domain-containing protein [Taibaiella lutea]KAA5536558.1 T9SS type A sorting domain-containing protein [Taibaiella lutea]